MTVWYRSTRTGSVAEYGEPFGPYERSDVWERFEPEPEPEPKPAPKQRARKTRKVSHDSAPAEHESDR